MTGTMGVRKLVTGALAAAVLVVAAAVPSVAWSHDTARAEIDVCCAWSSAALADGVLTYRISGGSATLQQRAVAGVENWDDDLRDLEFVQVFGNTNADVTIKITKGGGPFVAGQTGLKFQLDRTASAFFITGASITVFGARSDADGDAVEEITAHEFGHALGVGHANESGFLMSTSLDQIPGPEPTRCDVDAVEAANEWYFDDPNQAAAPPSVDHVHC
jgi:predicted Zn-dependent protease